MGCICCCCICCCCPGPPWGKPPYGEKPPCGWPWGPGPNPPAPGCCGGSIGMGGGAQWQGAWEPAILWLAKLPWRRVLPREAGSAWRELPPSHWSVQGGAEGRAGSKGGRVVREAALHRGGAHPARHRRSKAAVGGGAKGRQGGLVLGPREAASAKAGEGLLRGHPSVHHWGGLAHHRGWLVHHGRGLAHHRGGLAHHGGLLGLEGGLRGLARRRLVHRWGLRWGLLAKGRGLLAVRGWRGVLPWRRRLLVVWKLLRLLLLRCLVIVHLCLNGYAAAAGGGR